MRRNKYTPEQVIGILKEAEAGLATGELCRKYGISDATYYNWKAKYGGMGVSDAKKLKALEEENRRLKHIVADQTLENRVIKELLSKKY